MKLRRLLINECPQVGELFGSGTMPGGCSLENGPWLQSGNTLTLQIDKIGALANKVV